MLEREHAALFAVADASVAMLQEFDSRLIRRDVDYDQHRDFAARARQLAMHLKGALMLADETLYPSAFSLLRTALEHQLTDRLLFLGRHYVQRFRLDDEQWQALAEAYERREPYTLSMARPPERDSKGNVTVVRRGLYAQGETPEPDGRTLSWLYFVLDDYSPFVGRRSDQEFLNDGLTPEEHRRQRAKLNQERYEQYLRWSSVKASLATEGFYTETQLRELEVHYRFLSAFVHGTQAAYELAYPRGIVGGPPPSYDHYSSELALLYVLTFAANELRALLEMASRPPVVEVGDADEVSALADAAATHASHLWFPGGRPHEYDRVTEANRRAWRPLREQKPLEVPPRPEDLTDDEVGYYENPLRRLIALHTSAQEMTTGLSYRSPWERQDARTR